MSQHIFPHLHPSLTSLLKTPIFYQAGMEKLQPYLMPIMIMLVVRSFLGDGAGKKEEGGGAEKAEAAKKVIKAAK